MKVTITLDPGVHEMLRAKAESCQRTFDDIVNETLRYELEQDLQKPQNPFHVITFSSDFQPGIDPTKLNRIHDELLASDYLEKHNAGT